jgi:hypothetical protein
MIRPIERPPPHLLLNPQTVKEKEAESEQLAAKLVELKKAVKIFEESFQQVALATGLSEPDDIISKFYLKEEIRTDLNRELAFKTQKLADLKIRHTEQVAQLQVRVVWGRRHAVNHSQTNTEVGLAQ